MGAITVGLRGVGVRLLGLLGTLVLARLLTPADFGVVALGLTFTFAGQFLADAGVGAALVRRDKSPPLDDYRAALGLQLAVSVGVCVVAVIWVLITPSKPAVVTTLFIASLPIIAFRLPAHVALERQLRFGPGVTAELAEVLAFNVFAVTAVLLGAGVYGLAAAAIIKAVVGSSVLNFFGPIGWTRPIFNLARVRGLLSFGVQFQASDAVTLAHGQLLNLSIAAIGGFKMLGLWTIASRMISVPQLLFESLWRISFPALVRLEHSGEETGALLGRGVTLAAIVGGAILVPATVAINPLIMLLLGPEWQDATLVLPFVFLGMAVNAPLSVMAIGCLYARGHAATVLQMNIAYTTVTLAVSLTLLAPLGYVALGVGFLIASVFGSLWLDQAVASRVGVRIGKNTLLPALCGVVAVVGGYLVSRLHPALVVQVIVSIVVSLSVYSLLIWLFQRDDLNRCVRMFKGLRPAVQ